MLGYTAHLMPIIPVREHTMVGEESQITEVSHGVNYKAAVNRLSLGRSAV